MSEHGAADLSKGRTAHDLEWGYLLEHLAGLCAAPAAARRMRVLEPAPTLEAAREHMRLTAEALLASADDAPVPAKALPDVDEALPRLEKGSVGSGEELRAVCIVLEQARALRAYGRARAERQPQLARAVDSAPELDELLLLLESAIEADGSVSDRASPTLRDARRRVADQRRELSSRLSQLVRRYGDVLRDEYWTERDGRFVLPVRSDAHVRVDGIVLGSSASGGTLYVEPAEVTALGNRLKVAEAEVEREIARVLARLSSEVQARGSAILDAYEACLTADRLAALGRFAAEQRATAVMPGAFGANLVGMRHPLLALQGIEVVENDIQLERGQALVLSGPNAGGKTVALKCLGLAAWMVRSGIPLPADPRSEMGFFDPVLTDVGDEQSILYSLSTFSAHVKNLASILERAGNSALVLLDEVAAGTDPEEGSALASAVLEALVERGAAVAVTTHYERLKELGAKGGAYQNGSVGFDLERMAPTFRLTLGVPGASSALAVAQRFGVPHAVVARAQSLLPERALDREELVQKLERERSTLEGLRLEAERELGRQRQLTSEITAERKRARDEERARLAEESRELLTEVRRARAELREARKKLERPSRTELGAVERAVSDAARHVAIGSELERATRQAPTPAPAEKSPAASELVRGARVFLSRFGQYAEVLEPPAKGMVRVAIGALKQSVRVDELRLEPNGPKAPKPKEKAGKPAKVQLSLADGFVPVRTSDNTLDLRGQRVDEALDAVDAFVDQLLRRDENVGWVLHGHGTGALKLAVRAHLSAAAHVRRAKPAEPDDGGDAFTVFWLGAAG